VEIYEHQQIEQNVGICTVHGNSFGGGLLNWPNTVNTVFQI